MNAVTRELSIPIRPGVVVLVQTPYPLTEEDWEQFQAVLAAMKPGLVVAVDPVVQEIRDSGWLPLRERTEVRPRKGDLEAATQPHPFQPSGEHAGASRAERCDLCGLTQRGPDTMHPDAP